MNEHSTPPDFWQNQYEAETIGWDRGAVHPAMLNWIADGQLSLCRIVVPGCGRGHEVIHLSQHGFTVTAIDYAPAPIEFLRANLAKHDLEATLFAGDLFSFTPEQPFDAVYEQTCLCAIAPRLRTAYADLLFDWLRPGGKLFLLMMQTGTDTGPPFHCPVEEMRELFPDHRWQWPSQPPVHHDHPSGRVHEMATVLTRTDNQGELHTD